MFLNTNNKKFQINKSAAKLMTKPTTMYIINQSYPSCYINNLSYEFATKHWQNRTIDICHHDETCVLTWLAPASRLDSNSVMYLQCPSQTSRSFFSVCSTRLNCLSISRCRELASWHLLQCWLAASCSSKHKLVMQDIHSVMTIHNLC